MSNALHPLLFPTLIIFLQIFLSQGLHPPYTTPYKAMEAQTPQNYEGDKK